MSSLPQPVHQQVKLQVNPRKRIWKGCVHSWKVDRILLCNEPHDSSSSYDCDNQRSAQQVLMETAVCATPNCLYVLPACRTTAVRVIVPPGQQTVGLHCYNLTIHQVAVNSIPAEVRTEAVTIFCVNNCCDEYLSGCLHPVSSAMQPILHTCTYLPFNPC